MPCHSIPLLFRTKYPAMLFQFKIENLKFKIPTQIAFNEADDVLTMAVRMLTISDAFSIYSE